MLDWNNIDTVLLDMDGTLLDLHFDNYFWQAHLIQRYSELHAIPVEIAKIQLNKRFKQVEGTLSWYCLDFWTRELSVNILELKQEVEHMISAHPFALDFLRALVGWKQVVLVTNAHPGALGLKLAATGIGDYFDKIISSHQLGYAKENLEFWNRLQIEQPMNPKRTLLVEDTITILRTAKTFGIAHLLAVSRPDSKSPLNLQTEFSSIEHFGELLQHLLAQKV